MEESWWNEVKDALFDYLDLEFEDYSLATMQLSFDNLPHCLKPCLLYMGMFPEDTRIPVSKLISVWTAEGFVQNIESAEDYLMDLISSNVVMVSKKSYDGKVKICQVHDAVRHFCLERSREENFMLAVKGHASQFQPVDWKGSRVSFSFSEEHSKFGSLGSKTRKPFQQHLRSLITTNGGIFYNWNPFCQISELRLVKVLDLSSHRVNRFSSATLKPLNHLKYLAVWADKFYFHPESHLPHIETLILKNYNEVVLPASFWEMKKLWHVEIRGSFVVKNNAEFDKHGLFEGSSKLENLRYLRRVAIDETDSVDVLVSRCPNLQQLHITFKDNYPSAKLEDLTHLRILHLSFRGSDCPSVLQLPLNLKKLVLSGLLIESTIPFIAGPSSLEYLQLQNLYFPRSKEWCLGDITFPNLKLLKLVNLDISRWDASEESFPLLETLVIRRCERLEEIPLGFADISTLKQIMLIRCQNNALEASAVKIKEEVEAIEGCDRIDITTQVSIN
uniref:Tospovirus resistance protein A n=1 Tax=Solanum tuberosum TaxID=4113 RepID=M1CUP1_SOLTU